MASLLRIVQILAALVVVKTAVAVLWTAANDYFPPNFDAAFLLGRQPYFYGPYRWAFYTHILTGPFCLFAGLVLLSKRVRRRLPQVHRRLGRIQVALVLLVVAPSGLWMSFYAMSGPIAAAGFAALSIVTAFCTAMGWRAAIQRRFDTHRVWMLRCYALLYSAVVIRVIGGASEVLGLTGIYPLAAWISWLVPLAVLEIVCRDSRLRLDFTPPAIVECADGIAPSPLWGKGRGEGQNRVPGLSLNRPSATFSPKGKRNPYNLL